jgi:hypothetical protein
MKSGRSSAVVRSRRPGWALDRARRRSEDPPGRCPGSAAGKGARRAQSRILGTCGVAAAGMGPGSCTEAVGRPARSVPWQRGRQGSASRAVADSGDGRSRGGRDGPWIVHGGGRKTRPVGVLAARDQGSASRAVANSGGRAESRRPRWGPGLCTGRVGRLTRSVPWQRGRQGRASRAVADSGGRAESRRPRWGPGLCTGRVGRLTRSVSWQRGRQGRASRAVADSGDVLSRSGRERPWTGAQRRSRDAPGQCPAAREARGRAVRNRGFCGRVRSRGGAGDGPWTGVRRRSEDSQRGGRKTHPVAVPWQRGKQGSASSAVRKE